MEHCIVGILIVVMSLSSAKGVKTPDFTMNAASGKPYVILPCSIQETPTKGKVEWQKLDSDKIDSLQEWLYNSALENGTGKETAPESSGEKYVRGPHMFSLMIRRVSKADEGRYRCSVLANEDVFTYITALKVVTPPTEDTISLSTICPIPPKSPVNIWCNAYSTDLDPGSIEFVIHSPGNSRLYSATQDRSNLEIMHNDDATGGAFSVRYNTTVQQSWILDSEGSGIQCDVLWTMNGENITVSKSIEKIGTLCANKGPTIADCIAQHAVSFSIMIVLIVVMGLVTVVVTVVAVWKYKQYSKYRRVISNPQPLQSYEAPSQLKTPKINGSDKPNYDELMPVYGNAHMSIKSRKA